MFQTIANPLKAKTISITEATASNLPTKVRKIDSVNNSILLCRSTKVNQLL